ncbi:MAG TPA: pantoate--beta-alanine ligase [Caulobacteraceae bacterium]|nr:pantoate--beta-alanine ligase [Caulobacteraceae bacterium]
MTAAPPLPIVRTVAELRAHLDSWRLAGRRVGMVPTMGALHEGHLSLLAHAQAHAERTVASIFVNPAQFAAGEDFGAYPRGEARDAALLAGAGCDLLFAPEAQVIYPPGFSTTVTVAGVSEPLEGHSRPTHFAGVATVVAKLLIQARPDVAVFGEKDYQQLQVIRRLALDLDLPTRILGAPTVRAADGLALSSRNAYLSERERSVAPALYRALTALAEALEAGQPIAESEAQATASVLAAGFHSVDYIEARHAETLERLGPGPVGHAPARLLAAARLGKTRLIDNRAV